MAAVISSLEKEALKRVPSNSRAKSSPCDAGGGGGRTQLTLRGIYSTGQIWGNSYAGLVGLCSESSVPENLPLHHVKSPQGT